MQNESFSADARLIQSLVKRARTVACGEDRILFKQGDLPEGLFILIQGKATLVMTSDSGHAVMFREAGPGSLLGLPGMISKRPYTLTAFIQKDSVVSFITGEDYEQTIREEPELYPSILEILAAEVRDVRQVIRER